MTQAEKTKMVINAACEAVRAQGVEVSEADFEKLTPVGTKIQQAIRAACVQLHQETADPDWLAVRRMFSESGWGSHARRPRSLRSTEPHSPGWQTK